eukprot:8644368-Pyramimonas_sp.AAC.1
MCRRIVSSCQLGTVPCWHLRAEATSRHRDLTLFHRAPPPPPCLHAKREGLRALGAPRHEQQSQQQQQPDFSQPCGTSDLTPGIPSARAIGPTPSHHRHCTRRCAARWH